MLPAEATSAVAVGSLFWTVFVGVTSDLQIFNKVRILPTVEATGVYSAHMFSWTVAWNMTSPLDVGGVRQSIDFSGQKRESCAERILKFSLLPGQSVGCFVGSEKSPLNVWQAAVVLA